MATERVGVYRKYYGPVPKDKLGHPLPKSEWPRKRPHSWVARWFDFKGKRYSRSFKTRKEAQQFAEQKQKEIRCGKPSPQPRISVAAHRREHQDLMNGNLAPKSLQQHLASLDLLIDLVGKKKLLHRIKVRDIERFRANRLKSGVAPSTANKNVKTLRRAFNLAILRGYLENGSNPCVGIPMLRIGAKQQTYMRPDDFRTLYRQAPNALWRALLMTFYTAGLRLREAMNLTWQEIDFESNLLCISRRTASGSVQAWTPKDHELRTIPLPEQTIALLTAWQSVAPERCPYVFMEPPQWKYYCQCLRSGTWRSGQDLTNNALRRFQTLCRRGGVSHSDIRTPQRYYLSVQPEDINRAQAIQAAIVGEIPRADLTDPKVTHSRQKRVFSGRQGSRSKSLTL